jgi:hypothetical protein
MCRVWFAAGAVLAAVALAGCTLPPDPYNRLTRFRVLALIADPPNPAPGETATISALSYLPDRGVGTNLAGLTYAWSWCPAPGDPNAGYPCGFSSADAAQLVAGGINVPPLDLGTAATASLTNVFSPAQLAQLCADSSDGPAPDCQGGFPVQVKVTVRVPAGPDQAGDDITAVADLRLRFDPADSANLAPPVEGLSVVKDGVDVPLASAPAVILPRHRPTVIKAVVPASASEAYSGRDADLHPALVRERLTFTWFVETGDTEDQRTGYLEGAGTLERNLKNKWTPGVRADFPRDRALLVVVARDDRGGASWRAGQVLLEDKP